MLANYYTLRHLARDFDAKLAGATISQVFCQSKNELVMAFDAHGDGPALLVSCDPALNYVLLRGTIHRAKKNSVDVLKPIWGKTVAHVFIQPADREIIVETDSALRAAIQLFGSKANVILADHTNSVLDTFLHRKETVGTTYRARIHDLAIVPHDLEEFRSQLLIIGNILLSAGIKRLFPLFSNTLIREVCYRASLGEQQLVAELQRKDHQRLYEAILQVIGQLEGPASPRIYHQNDYLPTLSIIPLRHVRSTREEEFDSVHDAIKAFLNSSRKQKALLEEKETLVRFLEREIAHAERTLQKIATESQSLERALQYETYGKLLMANLHEIGPRARRAQLENVFAPNRGTVTIPLDASLSLAKNAERYFEKAKNARVRVKEKTKHQQEVEEQWEQLRELFRQVSSVQTTEQFTEFASAHAEQLRQVGYRPKNVDARQSPEQPPFRTFVVAGGFTVWVGKSSENNDLLTLKYAKPNDLWFHARGSSGSHVVLRMGTGKGEPGKRSIGEAAAIAAYYSKMKHTRHVPVAMTQRKYVRKPKGAPAGTVTIEREKLIFVDPKLPDPDRDHRV